MICQQALIDLIEAQLPAGSAAKTQQEVVLLESVNTPVSLKAKPLPLSLELLTSDMATVLEAGKDYSPNYLTGTVTPLETGEEWLPIQVLASYQSSMAATWAEMSVTDLGARCPQKRIAQLPVSQQRVPLPQSVQKILGLGLLPGSARRSDASCGKVQCGPCNFVIQDGCLFTDVLPDSGWVEICYFGGFVADRNGCYPNLTAELADLAVYKALALAYASPLMAVALSGASQSFLSQRSSQNDKPTGPIIARDQRIGDESVAVRWSDKGATDNPFSGSNLRKTAEHYQKLYEDGIAAYTSAPAVVTSSYCAPTVAGDGCYNVDRYLC